MLDRESSTDANGEASRAEPVSPPWEMEKSALERLAHLDLEGCRDRLRKLAERLERDRGLEHLEEALYLHDVLGQIRRFLHRTPLNGESESERRGAILRALSGANDGPELRRAFLEQAEQLLRPFERGATAFNPVVERARRFIEEHCTRKLSLRQIAEHVSVSRNYLSTLFRKQCGCTITEYIHRVRMKRAELLLLAGGRTISEVAYTVGYQNYRDFYRNFVKYTKSSPKRFRESLGRGRRDAEAGPGSSRSTSPARAASTHS